MIRSLGLVGALLLVLSYAPAAHGLTTPIAGAVAFPSPSSALLRLPFPAGHQIRVSAGYSPSGGSSLHADTNLTYKANEYYALDFVYANEPNNGKGLPVVAALPGEVVRAGWSDAGWANYGLRVILRHDLGDGHIYHSTYAHLNAIDSSISEGVMVSQGQVLGELGQSCQGALSCSSFSSPHLHWNLHRDSLVGGSGTGGSYGGNAVVPEPFDGAEDIVPSMLITSTNSGTVVCGDGYCSGDEDHESCPQDCPICDLIPPAGRVIDESETLCFVAGGTPSYWHDEAVGYDSSLKWTMTTADATVDNHGIWQLSFEQAGDYLLEIYTSTDFAQSQQASYAVTHDGVTEDFVIDQTAVDGWQAVGTLHFAAGDGQSVRLDDNTGEALSLDRKLAFDAIRLTGQGGSSASSSGEGGGTSSSGEGGSTTSGTGGSTTSSSGEGDGGSASGLSGDDEGCSCTAAGDSASRSGLGGILVLLLLGARWRRRARPA